MPLEKRSDDLLFSDDEDAPDRTVVTSPWKIMIVDDDEEIHGVTRLALTEFSFDDRPLEFIAAHSGKEAKGLIEAHPDTAVLLLDVVMESEHAGLEVARYKREDLKNQNVRIILRTG